VSSGGLKAEKVMGEEDGDDADRDGDNRADEPFPAAGAAFERSQAVFERFVKVLVQDPGRFIIDVGELFQLFGYIAQIAQSFA
jgi:hypothetical protein